MDIGAILSALFSPVNVLMFIIFIGVISIAGYIFFLMKTSKNPYVLATLPVISKYFNKGIKKVELYEVYPVENLPIVTYKTIGYKGAKGLYIPPWDIVLNIPEQFYVQSYDTLKLLYKKIGSATMLPLRLSYRTYDKAAVEEYEKQYIEYQNQYLAKIESGVNKNDIPPFTVPESIVDRIVISGVSDRESLVLSDAYMSSVYAQAKEIYTQTLTSMEEMIAKAAPMMGIIILGFLITMLVVYMSLNSIEVVKSYSAGVAPPPGNLLESILPK